MIKQTQFGVFYENCEVIICYFICNFKNYEHYFGKADIK